MEIDSRIYNTSGKTKELANDAYNGWHYKILSIRGNHPCCYIEIPKGHPLFNKSYSYIETMVRLSGKYFNVHGGITYAGDQDARGEFWIGWDYYHADDYGGETGRLPNAYENVYTMDILIKDVHDAIDQLNEISFEKIDNREKVIFYIPYPKKCSECPCFNNEHGYCQADSKKRMAALDDYSPDWCPIIPC